LKVNIYITLQCHQSIFILSYTQWSNTVSYYMQSILFLWIEGYTHNLAVLMEMLCFCMYQWQYILSSSIKIQDFTVSSAYLKLCWGQQEVSFWWFICVHTS
jgi:hypothetical protein